MSGENELGMDDSKSRRKHSISASNSVPLSTPTRDGRRPSIANKTPDEKGQQNQQKGQQQQQRPNQKNMTKAERRAVQEKQRAEKLAKKGGAAGAKGGQTQKGQGGQKGSKGGPSEGNKQQKKNKDKSDQHNQNRKGDVSGGLAILSHLPEHSRKSTDQIPVKLEDLHPAIVDLGLKLNRFIVVGGNERCLLMLSAFKLMIAAYRTPNDKDFCRDLEARLNHHVEYLANCRLLSSNMRNAIRVMKLIISNVEQDQTDEKKRKDVLTKIDNFIKSRIELAGKELVKFASSKIGDDEVILVYASSFVVQDSLIYAHSQGKKFRVIVVDSRPRMEGKECLRNLTKHGINCTYILISAISYVLREVTKVFLGAHTFFANGHMMSRVGSAVISMMAKCNGVPVIVCCESYKFSRRVQTDSLVYNELVNIDGVLPSVHSNDEEFYKAVTENSKLHVLNFLYDVTPPELIDLIVTEFGLVPTTSVPVILREYDVAKNEIA